MTPYYSDQHVTIYHGDCREILPKLEQADVLISDPPYAASTHKNSRSFDKGRQRGSHLTFGFEGITADGLRCVLSMTGTRRWSVFTCDILLAAPLIADPPAGLEFIRMNVWAKRSGTPQITGDRPAMWWEPIMAFHPPGRKRWNGGGCHGNYFDDIDRAALHPTPKPLGMVRSMVSRFSDPGELIIDPYAGGGTTLRAAKDLGRLAIGIEIDERYCEIAANRMAQEVLDLWGTP